MYSYVASSFHCFTLRVGGVTDGCVLLCDADFLWRVQTVKERKFKRNTHPHSPLCHQWPLADPFSSALPCSWNFWSQYCDAVYVTQCVTFLGILTFLLAIDLAPSFISDWIGQVSAGYVINRPRGSNAREDVGECRKLIVPSILGIPADTAVPHWAYLNVTTNDIWNQTASEAVVGQSLAHLPNVFRLLTITSLQTYRNLLV